MRLSAVAGRYARALLNVAIEQGKEDEYLDFLEIVCNIYESNYELFDDPILKPEKKVSLIRNVLADFGRKMDEFQERFLILLFEKKRQKLIRNIRNLFEHEKILSEQKVPADLQVAHEPNDKELSLLRKLVRKFALRDPVFRISVDESLIAGALVEFEGFRLDTTVRGRLRKISREALRRGEIS
ncbi:F0F1 ATP synthase subunit delta [Thermotoga sp. KOL6]|uniref:F0F1 ATP synthase subunit delta n=1 Tax=Thermotoga sp. KOL6 TaxID=126741 RepID=UPI000C75FFE6|nr:F0F1 ATP synthase subunit delta [Thermotoga sp. KOL6]PLV60264.1 ATP F0F1 synthase subunit delta [Thermotoga sp. KOL6]